MSDSESDDAELLAEERRIREEYGLQMEDDDEEEWDGADETEQQAGGDNFASEAIGDEMQRVVAKTQGLQEERDLLRQQVGCYSTTLEKVLEAPDISGYEASCIFT